jgi:hypothetical protein
MNHFHGSEYVPVCRTLKDRMFVADRASFSVQDQRIKFEAASTGVSCDKYSVLYTRAWECEMIATGTGQPHIGYLSLIARGFMARRKKLPLQIRHEVIEVRTYILAGSLPHFEILLQSSFLLLQAVEFIAF